MRQSRSQRNQMAATAREMLSKLESLCQAEYTRIENCHKTIAQSQALLAKLEPEYLRTRDLLAEIEAKNAA